jgi:hypothetical protein
VGRMDYGPIGAALRVWRYAETGEWRGVEDLNKITVQHHVKFARVRLARKEPESFQFFFLFFFLIMQCERGAGRGLEHFQEAPSQPASHRAEGPNKGPWPAPFLRFCY